MTPAGPSENWKNVAPEEGGLTISLDRSRPEGTNLIPTPGSWYFYGHTGGRSMARGTVKWFNDQKGYGFIASEGASDAFGASLVDRRQWFQDPP